MFPPNCFHSFPTPPQGTWAIQSLEERMLQNQIAGVFSDGGITDFLFQFTGIF